MSEARKYMTRAMARALRKLEWHGELMREADGSFHHPDMFGQPVTGRVAGQIDACGWAVVKPDGNGGHCLIPTPAGFRALDVYCTAISLMRKPSKRAAK
jgi:hypothetical protein